MMTSVSRFIDVGTNISVLFSDPENPDKMKWVHGEVKKVQHGDDITGRYAECEVLYDDGDIVRDQRFYDEDFGEDCWKFSSPLSKLIINLNQEIASLKEDLEDDPDYEPSDTSTSEDDGNTTDDDAISSVTVDICNNRRKPRFHMICNIVLITLVSLTTLHVTKIGCVAKILPDFVCS